MTNYDKIIEYFQDTASRLQGVRGFMTGQLEEVDIRKLSAETYPLVYIEPITATIDTGSMVYSFSVYVMEQTLDEDIVDRETELEQITDNYEQIRQARNNSYNNTLMILKELINTFKQNLSQGYYGSGRLPIFWLGDDVVLQVPITCEPFTMKFNNIMTGWTADINIEVNNTNDLCTSAVYLSE